MAATHSTLAQWLTLAGVSAERLTVEQGAVLQAAFRFRQQVGEDYYSTRLLSHFLVHCGCAFPVAQVARLLEISRPTASRQQGLSSKEVIPAAHHRMAGRSHGKLLPRYAGPIAEFVLTHADASRYDTLDFIERTWGVRVSTVALPKFLKKYGLDRASRAAALADTTSRAVPVVEPERSGPACVVLPEALATVPPGQPVPLPAPPFSSRTRTTPALSC
jgi:hypothetical protein